MADSSSQPVRRPTSTSTFGVGRRESHDSSAFYARFTPPVIDDDEEIGDPPAVYGPIHGDARNMEGIPDRSVALVVTSPPYFVGKDYEQGVLELSESGDSLAKTLPASYEEYLRLLSEVFSECVRVLEPGGRIAVNVANLGRKPYRSLSADVIGLFSDLGLLLRGEIIWRKAKAMGGTVAWGSFRQPSNPVLRDTTERIIVASKGRFNRARTWKRRSLEGLPYKATITTDEFIEATLDVWEIPAESARRVGHPAPFPLELPLRLIHLYTYECDLVLDPFMGSGTTLVAAQKTSRRSVGYDISSEYVRIAERRLKAALISTTAEREPYISSPDGSVTLWEISPPTEDSASDESGDNVRPSGSSTDNFQARAVKEGKRAQDLARMTLEEAGFSILRVGPKLGRLGIQFNFLVRNEGGQTWYVDVSGAFTTVRPGLQRTDTLWKTLGRALVHLQAGDTTRILVLTSDLPKKGSSGDKALKAVGPRSIFDAVEMFSEVGGERLRHYAREDGSRPIKGYWTQAQIDIAFP